MSGSFDSHILRTKLSRLPHCGRFLVGYSGGADSTALLNALCDIAKELHVQLQAIHFNHAFHERAVAWAKHCSRFCNERGIELVVENLEINTSSGNLEARAREARYERVAQLMDEDTIFLTAHTADDRAETLILHAIRGSGLEGLASIPQVRPLGPGIVARPLLDISRSALIAYLEKRDIEWVEDPANLDMRFDRNFVRHQVLPLLQSRWPSSPDALARSARHLQSAAESLERLLSISGLAEANDQTLSREKLFSLGNENAGIILRAWLKNENAPPLPGARITNFLDQIAAASADTRCETTWAGWTLRLYQDQLFLLPPESLPQCPEGRWLGSSLTLGSEIGSLCIRGPACSSPPDWTVGPRRPGARMRLHEGGPRHKLKKVFQDQNIPPWLRSSIPVLYWDGEAVAVGDWLKAPKLANWLSETGTSYHWKPRHPELIRTRSSLHLAIELAGPA